MNKPFVALLTACVLLFGLLPYARARTGGAGSSETFAVSEDRIDRWAAFEGRNVETINVDGLRRTRKQTIEWMISTKVGSPFFAAHLASDLQVLYNTGNLYDLDAALVASPDGQGVDVTIILKDKWTLFPAFGAQGGGGSLTFGGGLFESNLLGYMTNASMMFWTFNNTTSYDLNLNQEYFHGTQTMWSVDVQDSIEPQVVHGYDGTALGQFAWRRQQKELMLGTHFAGPLRTMFYASVYQDTVFTNEGGFHPTTASGLQQRIYPKLIYGRVDWTNYLENGFELTVQPTLANFIGGAPEYLALEVDFKRVWILGSKGQDNFAMYMSTSNMGQGAPNYIYQVGGYYNVRGYPDLREFGRHVAFTNFEYRPFLFSHHWELFGADLMAVQAAFFTDAGSAWGDSSLTGESRAGDFHPLWSAGAGLRVNMVKFAGAIMRLDVARTISPDEGVGFSFGVGQFF